MNDKELDDFFRTKLQNPDIPYREEDWEKLRAKLDNPSPSPGKNGSAGGSKTWWMGLLALIMIGGALLSGRYLSPGSENSDSTAIALPAAASFDSMVVEDRNQGRINETKGSPTADNAISRVPPLKSDPAPEPASGLRSGKALDGKKESMGMGYFASGFSNNSNAITIEGMRSRTAPIILDRQAAQVLALDILRKEQVQDIRMPGNGTEVGRNAPSDSKAVAKTIGSPRFFISLALAPDVSALKIKDIRGLGNSVGFNLEYFIHSNISITAGAMYVFKTYQAGDGYSTGYVPAPSHVNGSCWVLDVPLNLRYYAVNRDLARWYLTAGLSSYLMLKEKYNLEYSSYNYGGTTYDNTLELKNKNKHYLDIVNLGIGYERVLSDRLSLQVEPYLKLPLKGVGEGDISLKSAGAFVGLKFGL